VIGENYVSVPTHFFKVVVGEMENSTLELEAYVLPNQVYHLKETGSKEKK
jgi:DNA/RNA endonuclease G (NUC1)